jgi:hypothetical protein
MGKRLFRVESTHELGAESNPRKSRSAAKHWHPDGLPSKGLSGATATRMLQSLRNRLRSFDSRYDLEHPATTLASLDHKKTRSSRRSSLSRRVAGSWSAVMRPIGADTTTS